MSVMRIPWTIWRRNSFASALRIGCRDAQVHAYARSEDTRSAASLAHGPAIAARAAPYGYAPGAVVRSRIRRRDRAGGRRAAPCRRQRARAVGPGRLPDGLLRHLVGLDELHLVRLRLRL